MRSFRPAAEQVGGVLLALLCSACLYSFVGGGLPSHVRTVSIEGLENATPQPTLAVDLEQKLRDQLPRNLGVRLAAASVADAVIRGSINGYDETVPALRPAGPDGRVDIVQLEVRITANLEIYDLREDRVLWKNGAVAGIGRYQPDEQPLTGRARALDEIVQKVIQGAQSQW